MNPSIRACASFRSIRSPSASLRTNTPSGIDSRTLGRTRVSGRLSVASEALTVERWVAAIRGLRW